MKTYLLRVEGVPFISIADAHVYPDKNLVFIRPNAAMDTLKNAVVKADTLSFYHNLYSSDIKINSKYRMGGYGSYDYINKTKKPQKIFFNKFRTKQMLDGYSPDDNVYETLADGIIEEEQKFEF